MPCNWSKAGYSSFEDCVNKNQDKSDPEAYCASIKRKLEATKENKWIEKEVLIESEGLFCYPDGCFKMAKEEFEKKKEYVDSIFITEGTNHIEPQSLSDVVGKINNLDIVEIDKKWWLKGKGHFNDEKLSPKFKTHLEHNLPIYGSIANFVEIQDGIQINMLPTHFLMSPDLEPNIPNAGIKYNQLIFKVKRLDNMSTNPELEKTKAENAKLVAELSSLKEQLKTITDNKRAELIKKLVNDAKYKEEELKEKSVPELESMVSMYERIFASNPKVNRAINVAKSNPSEDDTSKFWVAYNKKYKGEKA